MTKSNLKLAHQPLSPERENLAEKIAAVRAAEAGIERVNQAQVNLSNERAANWREIDRAKLHLDEARESAPRLITLRLLGEKPDDDIPTVAEAEKALRDAEQAQSDLNAAVDPMEQAMTDAKTKLHYAKYQVQLAINAVVRSEVPVGIAEKLDAAARQYNRLLATLELLRNDKLPEHAQGFREINEATAKAGFDAQTEWRQAFAALADDAGADLPQL